MSSPRVAAIGLASWDRFVVTDSYPPAGSYAIVRRTLEQSGGTTANTAHALAKLGVSVSLAAMVGDDENGRELHSVLEAAGCDCSFIKHRQGEDSDSSIIIVSGAEQTIDRTIYWLQGARLKHGDALPLNDLFAYDLVYLDVDDQRLRRFIVDLPIHVSPRTLILGSLTYLVEVSPQEGLDVALRHDYLCGNQRELCYVTGDDDPYEAVRHFQSLMSHADTRMIAISLGPRGCIVATETTLDTVPAFSVDVVDTTGAGDAFAAGVALGILEHRPPSEIGLIANAMGGLSIRELGARSSLPTRTELDELVASYASNPKGSD